MTVKIDLDAELEATLKEQAARCRLDPETYATLALEGHLRPQASQPPARPDTPHLSKRETELFNLINAGLAEPLWERYHELLKRRDNQTLTDPERQELIGIDDVLEAQNAIRLKALAELAQLWNMPIERLMTRLGIAPRHYDQEDNGR